MSGGRGHWPAISAAVCRACLPPEPLRLLSARSGEAEAEGAQASRRLPRGEARSQGPAPTSAAGGCGGTENTPLGKVVGATQCGACACGGRCHVSPRVCVCVCVCVTGAVYM